MPNNPASPLPDVISDDIPDDASVVSPDLAVTVEGEVLDLATGEPVSDAAVVGTPETPADPLAKTDGESFVPVGVSEVRDAMDAAGVDADAGSGAGASSSDAVGAVRPAALQNNQYGAYWGTYNGTPAFFEADGTLFVQQAKGVVDVSQWQGSIDWQKAKDAGVEGAIIRISYGWGNGFDAQALRNISECKRLGIPFGVYSYSYAYDDATAAAEGSDIVALLRQAGVAPGDLSYPVFYDLERWTWTGHTPPTSPDVYNGIVSTWCGKLQAAGYSDLSVYSYTSYLNGPLNHSSIRGKTRWVASYGSRTNFPFATNDRGWQYTSSGSVAGINGNVDLNVFGVRETVSSAETRVSVYRVYNKNSGLHHYTTNSAEASILVGLGWNDEGVSFVVSDSGTPVYRVYNPNDGNHLFTVNSNERDMLIRLGWHNEGIAWFMPISGNTPVYRLYNPNSGEHVYTTNYYEYTTVGRAGWHMEGVAWKAL